MLRIPCSHASVYLGRVRLGRAHQTTLSLNPSTKSSIFAIAFLGACVLTTYCLLNFPSPCLHAFFLISYQSSSDDPTVGRLRAAPHKYSLSSLDEFRVLTRFLYCRVHQDPCFSPWPVLKLMEPISSPAPIQSLAPPFPYQHVLCFSVDSLALLINYWVHLTIMLRRTVRPKRDCVARLVCTPCWSCSVFLRRGCEIVRVLIILFYKGIKGAAGRVGPYFHSCSWSGVYSHTGVFFGLLWICSIIKSWSACCNGIMTPVWL